MKAKLVKFLGLAAVIAMASGCATLSTPPSNGQNAGYNFGAGSQTHITMGKYYTGM